MSENRSLVALVKSVDEKGAGSWTAVASAPSVDRDGEVIEGKAFEPLPTTVPVRDGHFGGELVGSGHPYYRGDVLHLDGRFASTERAQEVRTLVREGHLATMSVVFLPRQDREVDGRRHITDAELLAVDFVEIPSNRDARVLAARGWRQDEPLELRQIRAEVAKSLAYLAELDLAEVRRLERPIDPRQEIADLRRFLAELER